VRTGSVRFGLAIQAPLFAATIGCAPIAPAPQAPVQTDESVNELKAEVARLTGELGTLQTMLADVRKEQKATATELNQQGVTLWRVEGAVSTLPESMKQVCPPPSREDAECKEPQIQRVVVSGSKMVVGDVEQVWIDPPGFALTARIDTEATNNALLADAIVEFERDGKSWVRFVVNAPDADEPVELERRVSSHVRVTPAGGTEIKRPIVRLRIKLGDIQDSFQFVLTDRGEYPLILGRSFLKDIALVEVGERYVQPRIKRPTRPAKSAP
jgi:hypothetical protein